MLYHRNQRNRGQSPQNIAALRIVDSGFGDFEDAKLIVLQAVDAGVSRDFLNFPAGVAGSFFFVGELFRLFIERLPPCVGIRVRALQIDQIRRDFFQSLRSTLVVFDAVAIHFVLTHKVKTAIFEIQLEVRGAEREDTKRE